MANLTLVLILNPNPKPNPNANSNPNPNSNTNAYPNVNPKSSNGLTWGQVDLGTIWPPPNRGAV